MKLMFLILSGLILFSVTTVSCKKKTEDFQTDSLSHYFSLQPGKYITYRLDSTVFTQQGRAEEIHAYQEKHVVDTVIADNLGRAGYRVFRYLRDTAGQNSWSSSGSYFIIPSRNQVEVVENNFRFLKLVLPLVQGFSWKGNRYLASEPYGSRYEFSDDNHNRLADWEFMYENINDNILLNGKNVPEVVTVTGPDESVNVPVADKNAFASKTYFIERYAKNIGLVYQEFSMWEYQPNPGGTPFKVGFEVKRSLIDNN